MRTCATTPHLHQDTCNTCNKRKHTHMHKDMRKQTCRSWQTCRSFDLVRFMSEMLEVTVCDEELCACCFLRQRPKPQLRDKKQSFSTLQPSPFVQKIAGGGGGGGVRRRRSEEEE